MKKRSTFNKIADGFVALLLYGILFAWLRHAITVYEMVGLLVWVGAMEVRSIRIGLEEQRDETAAQRYNDDDRDQRHSISIRGTVDAAAATPVQRRDPSRGTSNSSPGTK